MKAGLRRRLTVTVAAISALTLVILVVAFNLAISSSLSADADRLLEARAQAALEGLTVESGKVSIGETSDTGAPDAQVWIYSGTRNIERPPAGRRVDALADELAARGSGTIEDSDSDLRLYATPIQDAGGQSVGTVVAGLSLEPYERTARQALIGSILLAVFVLLLIVIATRVVLTRALSPVARMTAKATDWSEHDLDRRFNPEEPNDELTELAATFDQMLDRMAAMVRHERNFTAEISHELRTPLSSIAADAEVALRRDRDPDSYRHTLERISTRAEELTEILETLLSVARAVGTSGRTSDLQEAAIAAIDSVQHLAERTGVTIVFTAGAAPIPVQGDLEMVQRVIAPILENACAYARCEIAVAGSADGSPSLSITDDGSGTGADDQDQLFEPGYRGQAERNSNAPPGTGLGLSLSRRLARALGGNVAVTSPPGGGASFVVELQSPPGVGHH